MMCHAGNRLAAALLLAALLLAVNPMCGVGRLTPKLSCGRINHREQGELPQIARGCSDTLGCWSKRIRTLARLRWSERATRGPRLAEICDDVRPRHRRATG